MVQITMKTMLQVDFIDFGIWFNEEVLTDSAHWEG